MTIKNKKKAKDRSLIKQLFKDVADLNAHCDRLTKRVVKERKRNKLIKFFGLVNNY